MQPPILCHSIGRTPISGNQQLIYIDALAGDSNKRDRKSAHLEKLGATPSNQSSCRNLFQRGMLTRQDSPTQAHGT